MSARRQSIIMCNRCIPYMHDCAHIIAHIHVCMHDHIILNLPACNNFILQCMRAMHACLQPALTHAVACIRTCDGDACMHACMHNACTYACMSRSRSAAAGDDARSSCTAACE
jgi:hypothetical protein